MHDRSEELNDIDRALADALNVDVSPHFVARVRRRIADEPSPMRFWRGWRLVGPAVATAVALVTVVAFARMWPHTELAPPAIQARQVVIVPLPPADIPGVLNTPTAERVVSSRKRQTSARASSPSEPEVLVPRAEIEMYRRLIAAAQNAPGALVVEAPKDVQAGQAITEIAITPITIDPIAPPSGGEGVRK